jgi:hypothetical protein
MGPHWTKYKKWQFQPENSKLETTEMEIKILKPIFKKFSLHYPITGLIGLNITSAFGTSFSLLLSSFSLSHLLPSS